MKHKLVVVLLAVSVLLSGCGDFSNTHQGNQEKVQNSTELVENAALTSFPGSYQSDGEHAKIHIDHIEPREAFFISGTAYPMQLDFEQIGRKLMPDNGTNEMNKEQKQILSKEMTEDECYKEMFLWGEDNGTYYTQHGNEIMDCVNQEKKAEDYNLPAYEKKKNFAFASEEEAFEKVKSFLKEAGIELGDNYQTDTYFLDYATLSEQESHYDINGNKVEEQYKKDWSKEDDAYLFYIHQTYCGLRDFHHGDLWKGQAEDSNAQITVLYGTDGIEYMRVQNLGTYSMGGEQKKFLDFRNIAEILMSHFDSILDDASYEVTEAELICDYAEADSQGGNVITPVWAFRVTEKTSGDTDVNYEMRIDALTGKILQN